LRDPSSEQTAGGAAGKVIGRLKAAIGSATGRPRLEREGRLQETAGEAELDARKTAQEASVRERQAEVREERTETELERRKLQDEVAAQERAEQIEDHRRAAQREREAAEHQAAELDAKAHAAERRAESIDPEGGTQ
jgi:uncharacterized protein YjbJ (UPF0337 family)